MKPIKIDTSSCRNFIHEVELDRLKTKLPECNRHLMEKSGKGKEFTGWVNINDFAQEQLLIEIIKTASRLQVNSEIVVVVGIGGSYLGAKAIIEALNPYFKRSANVPEIVFAGYNLSEDYHAELIDYLDNKDYSVIVISKSGTTTEPAIAFRLLLNHLIKHYGEGQIKDRIVSITDEKKGALRKIADKYGFESFVIPDDIGGRYSVLSPVGLLPVATAGFDIFQLVHGARLMMNEYFQHFHDAGFLINDYALTRMSLERKGYIIELFATYQPRLFYFMEWLKQLFGESEGKENKGLFPASAVFTTDLHSLGQYIQEGKRILFETVIHIDKALKNIEIPFFTDNEDELNYLAGKNLEYVNNTARKATQMAHITGNVPNIEIIVPELNEIYLGQMIYMFEVSCAISGYLNEINPFDQPGVEAYKKNMFKLLGKPGF